MPDLSPGKSVVVGVADLAVARAEQGAIVTYALGSCIGLTAYDPAARVGGLLHYMLPQPGDGQDVGGKACMYGATGISLLLQRLEALGGSRARCILCAAGGAEIIADAGVFAIGKRNSTLLRKVFWKDGLQLAAEDLGGSAARTLTLNLKTGEVRIRTRDQERILWTPGPRPTALATGGSA